MGFGKFTLYNNIDGIFPKKFQKSEAKHEHHFPSLKPWQLQKHLL